MDLRKCSSLDVPGAMACLNYQPFILSNDVQTGVAWSWVFADDPRVSPPLVFNKNNYSENEWHNISDANGRLRTMYDDLLDDIALRFPNGTLLDVACNNGYFPVGAELRGMVGSGMDLGGHYNRSFDVLNAALGTKARFIHAWYDSKSHSLPLNEKFDVTVMSAIMCHMPDPLFFIREVAKVTRKAMLFWGQAISSESKVVAYNSPHSNLSSIHDFPNGFNDNTRISIGMFRECARLLGFSQVVRIEPRSTWLTELHLPMNRGLEEELLVGSTHEAMLLIR